MVKNACSWITSEARPAGKPSLMPVNSRVNWMANWNRPNTSSSLSEVSGRLTNRARGRAANRKRRAVNRIGGKSCKPSLMTTKLTPQMVTTARAVKMSGTVMPCFMGGSMVKDCLECILYYERHRPGVLRAPCLMDRRRLCYRRARLMVEAFRSVE